jgi:hypothetical protein
VVIYSMATSSAADAPRGMEFLYDGHRLNVATSRARALAIIVASPDLIRVSCRTPQQMVLANALCRAWETRLSAKAFHSYAELSVLAARIFMRSLACSLMIQKALCGLVCAELTVLG